MRLYAEEKSRPTLKRFNIRWLSAIALVLALAMSASGRQMPSSVASDQGAVVKRYCTPCHNDKLKTANLSLENADLSKVGENADVWEKVLLKLSSNQMPPAGMPRPDAPKYKAIVSYLESELDGYATAHPNPGHPVIHRLNRAEYSNAIRDLLALDINPGSKLPPDDSGYGFDNIGEVLSLSPILIERYVAVSRTVSRLAVGESDIKPQIDVFKPEREFLPAPKGATKLPRNERISDETPFDSQGGLSVRYNFPVDAEYVFKVALPLPESGFGESAAPVAKVLEFRTHVKAGSRQVVLTFVRSGAEPEIVPDPPNARGGGGGGTAAPAETAQLDLRLDGTRLNLYDIPAAKNGAFFNNLSISGPYNITGTGDSASRRQIFTCTPSSPAQEQACAHKILSTLARRAFRRPVTEADLQPLLQFYTAGRKEKDFDHGIELALRAILISPDFLFRVEHDPESVVAGSVYRVNNYEMASRLSFFLWSSIPDERLLGLADQGKLQDPKVIEQQVGRMLDDPKSKAFVSNFAGQYLYLRNLASEKPDPDEYPEFDDNLRRSFQRETELFFNAIVREDRPVTDLLDARFTFLNQRLADFYGVPNVYGAQFRRVSMTDPNRGGVLGQGSLLTVTSYPNRTSVVQRGKWVLENFLGSPPPPPPANVPALDPHGKDGKMSMRQAMEAHRANPVCASCHTRMDPIGFSLENFDGVGAWRDKDNGLPIDASGKMPDGTTFEGAGGLRQLLLSKHRDEYLSTFTAKLMTYALGRGLQGSDQPSVRAVVREAEQNGCTVPALIDAIVKTPQFQMRRSPVS